MTLGERIGILRREQKLSQEYIAEQLNVSRQAVSKWENGVSSPDTENLLKLAAILNVDVEYLATGELTEEMEPTSPPEPKPVLPPKKTKKDNRKLLRILLAAAVCAALVFCGLWMAERNNQEDMELLCLASANNCLQYLEDYRDSGSQFQYLGALGEFRTFIQSYHMLVEDTNKDTNYTFCNSVYSFMLLKQERIDAKLDQLIEIMEILSENIYNYTGHDMMYRLHIQLQHGE